MLSRIGPTELYIVLVFMLMIVATTAIVVRMVRSSSLKRKNSNKNHL